MNAINVASITKQLNTHALMTNSNVVAQQPSRLQELFARWQLWRRVRRDAAWLQNQPEYLLRDIGISRSDVDAIIRKSGYR